MASTQDFYQKNKIHVEMKAVTWQKDSHGLFDYETKSLSVKKYRVDQSCKVYRNDQEILLVDSKQSAPVEQNSKYLTQISLGLVTAAPESQYVTKPATEFFIYPSTEENEHEEKDNFLIVRSLKNKEGVQKGYQLEAGDILKLGRIVNINIQISKIKRNMLLQSIEMRLGRLTPLRIYFVQYFIHLKYIYLQQDQQLIQNVDFSDTSVQKTCKICLFDEQSEDNPFITPCKCKGSCQYVHFQCLKQWIESRGVKKQTGNTFIQKWKKLECEVCQEPLPKRMEFNGHFLDLAELERPDQPYIILESISKEKFVSKGLFLIKSPFEEPIKLGRGHQCEIRISDISVSRLHAFIKYENGRFIIIDNNSKFGTLVKMIKPFAIQQDKVAIQVGRTVLTFILKKGANFMAEIPAKYEITRQLK